MPCTRSTAQFWAPPKPFIASVIADGKDLSLLRLLLGGVGEDDATGSGLLLLHRPNDQTIAQGLKLHFEKTSI